MDFISVNQKHYRQMNYWLRQGEGGSGKSCKAEKESKTIN